MSDSFNASPVRILAFGELLWDMLPTGKKLGGAPVNFLYHAKTLGADVRALTRIGDDELGREILARLQTLGVPNEALQISKTAPTGTVDVSVDCNGSPSYKIVENVAWDEIQVDRQVLESAIEFLTKPNVASAFYFGSLALRSENNKEAVGRLLEAIPQNVMRICDLNLRAPFYDRETVEFTLEHADVFKLNDLEAVELDQLFSDRIPKRLANFSDARRSLSESLRAGIQNDSNELAQWAASWLDEFNLKTIILTCGADGAFLFTQTGYAFAPSEKVVVKDAVGAGDSFAAVCAVGLLRGYSKRVIIEAAAKRAAYVCTQEGGTPELPKEFADPFGASEI